MPRRRIDGSLREKYGLPPNLLGKHWNKDAVTFYNTFLREIWEPNVLPSTLELPRREFLLFGIARGRIQRLPKSGEEHILKALKLQQTADATNLRLGINKATLNKTLQSVLDWPYQIIKLVVGSTYAVVTAENRVHDGIDAEAVQSFAKAKQKHLRNVFSAIKSDKHSAQEMEDLYAKSEFDDQMFDDFDRAIEDMKARIEASTAVRRLERWAGDQ